jgi:hypothetical protein
MDSILRLAVYVLALNAFWVLLAVFLRFKIWLHAQKEFDIKQFLASLPRGTKVVDPWILVDGKWIKPSKATYHLSTAA